MCPRDASHVEFFLTRTFTETWRVSAEGGIAEQAQSGEPEYQEDGPVMCATCTKNYPTITKVGATWCVIDNTPQEILFEDESL